MPWGMGSGSKKTAEIQGETSNIKGKDTPTILQKLEYLIPVPNCERDFFSGV